MKHFLYFLVVIFIIAVSYPIYLVVSTEKAAQESIALEREMTEKLQNCK